MFSPGDPVIVWHEVAPSRTPREPHESTVDHVGQRTFTVAGVDATFNASTGRSRTVRGSTTLNSRQYVAVPADTDRAREVMGEQDRRNREDAAVRAVQAWLQARDADSLDAAIEALQRLR